MIRPAPGPREDAGELGRGAAKQAARCRAARARVRRKAPLQQQQHSARRREQRGDRDIRHPPRGVIGGEASEPHAGSQADDLADQETGQHRLGSLYGTTSPIQAIDSGTPAPRCPQASAQRAATRSRAPRRT